MTHYRHRTPRSSLAPMLQITKLCHTHTHTARHAHVSTGQSSAARTACMQQPGRNGMRALRVLVPVFLCPGKGRPSLQLRDRARAIESSSLFVHTHRPQDGRDVPVPVKWCKLVQYLLLRPGKPGTTSASLEVGYVKQCKSCELDAMVDILQCWGFCTFFWRRWS